MEPKITELITAVKRHKRVCILIHAKPDGDAIGSGVAFLNLLGCFSIEGFLACPSELPRRLAFVADWGNRQDMGFGLQECRQKCFQPDYIVSIDVAADSLLDDLFSFYGDIDFAIDHHQIHTLSHRDAWVVPGASASGELIDAIFDTAGELDGKDYLSPASANALYCAIASDSGCFKYGNTTSETHRRAARLLEKGADHEVINRLLFDTKTQQQLRAEAAALSHLELFAQDRIAFTWLTLQEIERIGVTDSDTDTISQLPRQIIGVKVGVFMRETSAPDGPDGMRAYKFSVRANDDTDVAALCQRFGGGGHRKAAGCTIQGDFESAKRLFLEQAEWAVNAAKS